MIDKDTDPVSVCNGSLWKENPLSKKIQPIMTL